MNGFLDTKGKLHECESYEHLSKAREIVDFLTQTEELKAPILNGVQAEDYLQKLGWIVIRTNDVYGFIGHYKSESSTERYHLTDKQKEWLNTNYEKMTTSCRESVDELFMWDR